MTWRWTVYLVDKLKIEGESKYLRAILDDILTICEEQIKPEFEIRDIEKIEIRPC